MKLIQRQPIISRNNGLLKPRRIWFLAVLAEQQLQKDKLPIREATMGANALYDA
jgi:hypothetical protein